MVCWRESLLLENERGELKEEEGGGEMTSRVFLFLYLFFGEGVRRKEFSVV